MEHRWRNDFGTGGVGHQRDEHSATIDVNLLSKVAVETADPEPECTKLTHSLLCRSESLHSCRGATHASYDVALS
jgi:hypothetical protein